MRAEINTIVKKWRPIKKRLDGYAPRTCSLPRRTRLPLFYMDNLKERCTGVLSENWGQICGQASSRRVRQSTANTDPIWWRIIVGVCHHIEGWKELHDQEINNCTLHLILLGCWNVGECDVRDMWHAKGKYRKTNADRDILENLVVDEKIIVK
jgi:hypothetical protein